MRNEDYEDLAAALRWGAALPLSRCRTSMGRRPLSREQRSSVKNLCATIGGIYVDGVPSWRLKETAEAKRAALQRVAELEAELAALRVT